MILLLKTAKPKILLEDRLLRSRPEIR